MGALSRRVPLLPAPRGGAARWRTRPLAVARRQRAHVLCSTSPVWTSLWVNRVPEEVARSKPAPDVYLEAAHRTRRRGAECLGGRGLDERLGRRTRPAWPSLRGRTEFVPGSRGGRAAAASSLGPRGDPGARRARRRPLTGQECGRAARSPRGHVRAVTACRGARAPAAAGARAARLAALAGAAVRATGVHETSTGSRTGHERRTARLPAPGALADGVLGPRTAGSWAPRPPP